MTDNSRTRGWGSEERAVFFRPWWRAALTLTLAAIPIALTPFFTRSPEVATWLGPLSVLPFVIWLSHGFRQIMRRDRGALSVGQAGEQPRSG